MDGEGITCWSYTKPWIIEQRSFSGYVDIYFFNSINLPYSILETKII